MYAFHQIIYVNGSFVYQFGEVDFFPAHVLMADGGAEV